MASAGRKTAPTTRYVNETTAFSIITGLLADMYSAYEPSMQSLSNALSKKGFQVGESLKVGAPLCRFYKEPS